MASERCAGLAAVLAISMLLVSPEAIAAPTAADRETARSMMKVGDQKLAAKDYRGALRAYETAHTIMGVPTTGVAVARAHIGLGQLIEAREILLEVARSEPAPGEPAPFTEARSEAASLAKDLEKRIPSLEIQVQGPKKGAAVELTVDGKAVPAALQGTTRKINPGQHVIVASSEGFAPATSKANVAERETKRVTLKLAPGEGDGDKGEEPKGGAKTSPAAIARYRDGLHLGVAGGAMLVVPFDGGVLFGGLGSLLLNIGVTEKVDLRFGASAAFHGGDAGNLSALLYLGTPLSVRVNLTSRFAVSAGVFLGFGTDFDRQTGFAGGPEWSLVSLRLGDKREYEIDFCQGFRFGNSPVEYHNGFVLTYLFLDDDG